MYRFTFSTWIAVVCAVLVVSITAQEPPAQPPAQGQGRGGRGGQPGAGAPAAPAAPAKPYIPLVASTLADHADTYYGELVTVTGAVETTLSKLAFSVDQDKTKSTGKD